MNIYILYKNIYTYIHLMHSYFLQVALERERRVMSVYVLKKKNGSV